MVHIVHDMNHTPHRRDSQACLPFPFLLLSSLCPAGTPSSRTSRCSTTTRCGSGTTTCSGASGPGCTTPPSTTPSSPSPPRYGPFPAQVSSIRWGVRSVLDLPPASSPALRKSNSLPLSPRICVQGDEKKEVVVSVKVTNTGTRRGKHSVLLFATDVVRRVSPEVCHTYTCIP